MIMERMVNQNTYDDIAQGLYCWILIIFAMKTLWQNHSYDCINEQNIVLNLKHKLVNDKNDFPSF